MFTSHMDVFESLVKGKPSHWGSFNYSAAPSAVFCLKTAMQGVQQDHLLGPGMTTATSSLPTCR